jgi:Na+/H+ antiporter NhaD/arsenite permease-like protein
MFVFYTMVFVFLIGYGFIIMEHSNKIDKAASALFTAGLLWTLLIIDAPAIINLGLNNNWLEYSSELSEPVKKDIISFITHHSAIEHLGDVASIIFFLLGAMTIVEVIDRYQGFRIITDKIHFYGLLVC